MYHVFIDEKNEKRTELYKLFHIFPAIHKTN